MISKQNSKMKINKSPFVKFLSTNELKEIEKQIKQQIQAIDVPGMTTTRLFFTDYNLAIKKASNSK